MSQTDLIRLLRAKLLASLISIHFITTSCVMALLIGSSCIANEPINMTGQNEVHDEMNKKSSNFIIDSETGSVAGIFIGMTETQIRESGWPIEMHLQILERDEYKVYNIHLAKNVHLKCIIYPQNTVYSIESSDSGISDEYGLGVGSKLSKLKNGAVVD